MERQIARLSRRELLKSVGIAGAGLSTLPLLTAFSDAPHQGVELKEKKAPNITYVGTFVVYCQKSGLVLDVKGGSLQDGAPVQQYHYHGGANQQWSLS